MKLNEIYEKAKLTEDEIDLLPEFIAGNIDFFDSPAYEKLFEYFAFEACEMPYGTAKARDGDPDCWILDRLEELGGSDFCRFGGGNE